MSAGYTFELSQDTCDPPWDQFVANTPGGHHVQTSLWSQVKATVGWSAQRIVALQGGRIVGGAQVLIRQMPLVGGIGYVSAGPLLQRDDPDLAGAFFEELMKFSRDNHLQYVVVQPPAADEQVEQQLSAFHFEPSTVELYPTATVIVDLSLSLDDILAQMRRSTRKNVAKSEREGVTVREGTREDMPTFCRLNALTCQRQNAAQFPAEYFMKMWDVFEPHGYVKMFIAEYNGEPVSIKLAVPFRDTVVSKVLGWSGLHQEHRPNEAAFWAITKWAKANGYRWYDLEGVDRLGAEEVLAGRPLPEPLQKSPDFFKYGFCGTPKLFPVAREYIQNSVLRWGYQKFFSGEGNRKIVYKLSELVRKR